MLRTLVLAGCMLALTSINAQARTLLLMCDNGQIKYEVRYDDLRKTVSTTHPRFHRPLRIERVQEDAEGILLWISMPEGPSSANMLAFWGKQRWVRHFQGYDRQTTDPCM